MGFLLRRISAGRRSRPGTGAKYELESAWPAKIEVSAEPTAAASQLLWETVTLTCEDIQRVSL
jgi:hypothetical protein